MKSYGKPDASWDDARFRILVEDALQMAKKHEKTFAVLQDMDGNAMVNESKRGDYSCVYTCWASAHKDKESSECKIELVDHVEWHRYTVDEMVPRVRNVLMRGIVEYGALGFLSEGRIQIRIAIICAQRLNDIHHEPFIVGLAKSDIPATLRFERDLRYKTGKSNPLEYDIMVLPLSERDRFVEQAACVVTGHECWSLPDNLPDIETYHYWGRDVPDRLKDTIVSDLRSIRLSEPVYLIYDSILEHWK